MKKRFFIQAGLTTMLFFLFLNLFGSPFSSVTSRSPEVGEFAHNWIRIPQGVIPDWGTYTELVQTEDLSFELVIKHCLNDYVFNCEKGLCVPPYEACPCYSYLH